MPSELNEFYDIEAEVSDEVSDSGDESIDGDIDVDLEGFVVGDEASISCDTTPAATPVGYAMYHRSLLSQSDGKARGASVFNKIISRYRDKSKRKLLTNAREEWEGVATQFGEGAEATEYYDDEERKMFV